LGECDTTGKATHSPIKSNNTKLPAFQQKIIIGLTLLIDSLIVILVGVGVYVVYVGWSPESFSTYALATAANFVITIVFFYFSGLYNFNIITTPHKHFHKIFVICGVVFLLLVLIAFSLKVTEQFSRVWSFSSLILETFLICGTRYLFLNIIKKLARKGRLSQQIVIVGTGGQCVRLIEMLEKQKVENPWIHIAGIYDDRLGRAPSTIGEYPLSGDLNDLILDARKNRIDDILIALPWSAEDRLLTILEKVKVLPAHIQLCPDLIGQKFMNHNYNYIGNISNLSIFEKPISDWNYVLKALEDKILASIILILIFPLLAIISIAIKLDSPGPAIFRQKRFGFNNEQFDVYKFRTMRHGRLQEKGVPQAKRNDPRITRVGKFLRSTSLDELPQLFNVLMGTMSLVGPRPHAVAHNVEYAKIIVGYYGRHRVKPGITGWAQVNGLRGETDTTQKMEARVKHDVYYIENWSLFLDFRILLKTVNTVLWHENAY